MDSITFKNFRKFKEETTFELNMINILVGPNNSGKSTLTKGLRLYLYNILNLQVNSGNAFSYRPFFDFAGDFFDNPHIGTFRRALSADTNDDYIVFSARFIDLTIETVISRFSSHAKDASGNLIDFIDKTSAPISRITFSNRMHDTRFTFDFELETYTVEFNVLGEPKCYKFWSDSIVELKKESNRDGLSDKKKEEIETQISILENCISFGLKDYTKYVGRLSPLHEDGSRVNGFLYLAIVEDLMNTLHSEPLDKNEGFDKFLEKGKLFLCYLYQVLHDTSDDIYRYVYSECPKTIEAHSITHSLVYNSADKNDYMAQTISAYQKENINEDDPEREFIKRWMNKFEIGCDFIIDSFGGECFKLEIFDNVANHVVSTPLLDKGVGTNQLMILLLHLATIMHQNRGTLIPYTIIIEEPEQNLHPKFQSLLADLFQEVYSYPQKTNNESWGISFIVETHSEYFVRRSQVLVANKNYSSDSELEKQNPFCVLYIDGNNKEEMVYELKYETTGGFIRQFGTGFFDEAANLDMEIIRMEKKNKRFDF